MCVGGRAVFVGAASDIDFGRQMPRGTLQCDARLIAVVVGNVFDDKAKCGKTVTHHTFHSVAASSVK